MAGFKDSLRGWFGKYRIDDPRPAAAAAPYTYYLPSDYELLAVAPGDLVKIIFESIPSSKEWDAERMWVIVTAADGDELIGTLNSSPADMPQLKHGDLVQFRRGDIIDIDWAEDRLVPPPSAPERRWYWERCFANLQQ